jgi:HEPN domain-containing protein
VALYDEFIAKAEADYRSALHLSAVSDPVPDAVCSHCQQCAEKYLKTFLEARGIRAPRLHDLGDLLARCEAVDATVSRLRADTTVLHPYCVDFRYPGAFASEADAEAALASMRAIRVAMRNALGLPR